ncbi:MAG: phospho-N-acetylmuramoyl-pentapeptide-transferase [Deltaproteobacteria bacterium]|jgi:phospho-N-acetylmuramoyl-pentapeptide-transferase|nr:phospho-N-acetylmuramoyl-pentapeptide-transferase [Deltaproteobacteria bacterium]
MLYQFLLDMSDTISFLNVFRYFTFRIILAAMTSMLLWFLFGRKFIDFIKSYRIKQFIREDGPQSHMKKSGTPTMGGVFILVSALFSCLLWVDVKSTMAHLIWEVILLYALIGFHDDYLKIKRRRNEGLSGRQKICLQAFFGLVAGLALYNSADFKPILTVPILKEVILDLGPFYVPFAALVLVSSSNSCNLADGLDGLAVGPIIMAAGTYMIFAYCVGNVVIARHLQLIPVPGSAELAVILASLIGGSLGFLWYNTYPAEIFLGDIGSLSLGAALGISALIVKMELLLIMVGGIFVLEACSVILQVTFFKATKGRRIFRMAPLHHHFELLGWAEPKIVVRLWILSIILSLAGLSTLKLR